MESFHVSSEGKTRLQKTFQELNPFQLKRVAENTQQVSLGIYERPVTKSQEDAMNGPALALAYWLAPANSENRTGSPDPTYILTRPGQQVNVRGIWSIDGLSMNIMVASIHPDPRGMAVGTRVELDSGNGRGRSGEGGSSASVSTTVVASPGQTVKLGQVNTPRVLYDVFFSLTVLQDEKDETPSFS